MEASHLIWTEEKRKEEYKAKILSILTTECRSPQGALRNFTVIDCPDWVIIVPVLEAETAQCGERRFLLVRQWRHGALELSLEFPGGVIEHGESPEAGAARELEEETAYRAGRLTLLGTMSPNPAIMSNRVHFFLAENLTPLPRQNLDEDEFVDAELIGEKEVLSCMGKPPYVNALSAAAMGLYLTKP